MNFNEKYADYLAFINENINKIFSEYHDETVSEEIFEAAKYSVNNGGKRIRPILCLAAAESFGLNKRDVLKFAVAIELIHSYSLVHDDLPAMDNDDFRRGKPSTHKKFGEAMGILTGDALLNLSAEIILSGEMSVNEIKASRYIFDCSGMKGMIAGQVYDIESEKITDFDEDFLYKISKNKTSKLIAAPLVVPAIICEKYVDEMKALGENLGILFQITDDVFDEIGDLKTIGKTPHKDADKITAIKVFGLHGARRKAEEFYNKCKKILSAVPDADFLNALVDFIYSRKN